jgi:hypothetical protein
MNNSYVTGAAARGSPSKNLGNNPGTMTSMAADDIIDSGFYAGSTQIQALDMDGSDDSVVWESADIQDLMITGNLSVVAWVKIDAADTDGHIFRLWGSGNRRWYIYASSGNLQVAIDGDGLGDTKSKVYLTTNGALSSGSWHQIGFTFASNTLSLYIDGSAVGAGDINKLADWSVFSLDGPTTADMSVAYEGTGGPKSEVVNLSMWNTGVLTSTDFTNLYNSGNGLNPKDLSPTGGANLVGSWLYNTSISYPAIVDNVGGVS